MRKKDQILSMKNISKSFPGVKALDNVDFELNRAEVHALVGENGAGKSTLAKILNGTYNQDEGRIFIDDIERKIKSPRDSQNFGINMVSQEGELIPELTVAENIYLGACPKIIN